MTFDTASLYIFLLLWVLKQFLTFGSDLNGHLQMPRIFAERFKNRRLVCDNLRGLRGTLKIVIKNKRRDWKITRSSY
jgi:hypothetical protein